MLTFPLIKLEDAEGPQFQLLKKVATEYGFVPNLYGKMANAPLLAKAYYDLSQLVNQTSFTEIERQIILLTISKNHKCKYCVAAHSMMAKQINIPAEYIQAIKTNQPIKDKKLQALRKLTESMVLNRGHADDKLAEDFIRFGYTENQILEIVLCIALKLMSNYTNHIANTEIDDVIKASMSEEDDI